MEKLMIEPSLALQIAIRARLLAAPNVTDLVPPDQIRSGRTRPDMTPTIIMADGVTEIHGHDYSAQRAAWVFLDLHIWTLDQGQDAAKQIAFEAQRALDGPLTLPDCAFDHFRATRIVYPRDPDPKYGHAVISFEALVRWTL